MAADNTKTQELDGPIPVIDLAPFRDGSPAEQAAVGKAVYEAFRDVGFAYLANHGVPQEVVDEAFAWNARFFDLPVDVKEKAKHPPEGWWHRGYSGVGREKVVQMVFDQASISRLRAVPDFKESFEIGREDDRLTPNIWLPEADLPGFRAFFARFFDVGYALELQVLRAVAAGMGLGDPDYFVAYHQNRDNQIRLLHYPPVEDALLRGGALERIASHTDFGTMTLLFQDAVGGLEVEDVRTPGLFHPAPYIPGTVVVNIGDFLQRWSNDQLKSTLHRVRAPPLAEEEDAARGADGGRLTKARRSIPYFVTADREKVIDCLPGCSGPDRPKKYEPINSGEYVRRRLNATY